ncbi:MAG: glycosyltransferase family 9 protein [Ignavibacteriaceae bacterium]|nr:glycosyltransferase family 9 protein [Ignavibacteriaceae bacterium]
MYQEKKILVIQTAFPGDAILTLPFIQELKKQKPDYSIDVLFIPLTAEIFETSSSINSVIPLDKKGKQKSFFSFMKFVKELKSKKYELVYSPHRSLRSALINLSLSAKESYGFENSALKFVYKNDVKYDPSAHEVRRNLEFLDGDFGGEKWRILPEISVPSESKKKVSDYLSENKINNFITIAPGSVWETKKYPVKYFKEVIEHFKKNKYQIVLIGGAEDKVICELLRKDDEENVHIAAGEFSFIETIELLRSSSLLICNDSAPTHLGMCVDIPVLTIYCSTVPGFGFYPYNNRSSYISYNELNCKPCGIHGFNSCPVGSFYCAELLLPSLVIEKAEKLISNAK